MGPAFYGLLGGFLVNIMPGAKRKQGLETLNVEQHRPPIAYIISYGILFIAFIGLYLLLDQIWAYCRGLHHFCGDGQSCRFYFCGSLS